MVMQPFTFVLIVYVFDTIKERVPLQGILGEGARDPKILLVTNFFKSFPFPKPEYREIIFERR